jgi:diacylglycerol kinase family enzyme
MTDPSAVHPHPIALLVNPASTAAHPGLVEMAERMLGPLGLTVVLTTQERGHAGDLARVACDAHGALTVVTMGGDGTAAEAAGSLIGTDAALVPIPAGSTNVFARTLGWPMDCEEAIRVLAREIRSGRQAEQVTIGRLVADGDERFFIVNAGAGIDAEAAETVERHPRMKRRIGQAWFAGAVAVAAVRTRRSNGVQVSIDGGTPFRLSSLSVACSRPYAYFGQRAFDLIPGAGQDGMLGWMGAATRSVTGPAIAATGALTGAWHLDSSRLAHGVSSHRITMESPSGVALQADGEPLGRFHHVTFEPAPGLRVLRAG